MKKLFTLFLVALVTTSLWAYDFQAGDLCYNITNDTVTPYTVEVTNKGGRSNYSNTTITIPASVEYNGTTYAVTSIGTQAFARCNSLTSVTIPNSVTTIEGKAFYNSALYKDANNWQDDVLYVDNCLIEAKPTISGTYTVKANTRLIANAAFNTCVTLESVTMPSTVTHIGGVAFALCTSLKSVGIPAGLVHIGSGAFDGCQALTSIDLPSSLKSIGDGAFMNCSAIASHITIPNGITCIEQNTFYGCWSISGVTIPNSVTTINAAAFYNCVGIQSISIPNSVITIGNDAFGACFPTSIQVESGNPNYDSRNNCNALIHTATNRLIKGCANTVIPNTVTTIANNAFYGVTPINLFIPKSVETIESGAFDYANKVESIKVESGNPNYDSRNDCNALIETSSNTLLLGCQNTTIPSTVTTIGFQAFRWCKGLTSITIPDNVQEIHGYAFYYCNNLTSVKIGAGVKTIAYAAFNQCESLTSINIPDNVEVIESEAFSWCQKLTTITIGSGIKSIYPYVFNFCNQFKTVICKAVNLPKSAEYSEDYIFGNDLTRLADVNLYVPAESIELYKTTSPWSYFGTILPLDQAPSDGVENICGTTAASEVQKVLYNGQVLIRHNDKTYDIMGYELAL